MLVTACLPHITYLPTQTPHHHNTNGKSRCGCNNSAMFADIVPEHMRSKIYAFDRAFEGAVGACGLPLVGLTAEWIFGYVFVVVIVCVCGGCTCLLLMFVVFACHSVHCPLRPHICVERKGYTLYMTRFERDMGIVTRPEQRIVNAYALSNALLTCLLVPWTLCLLFFTGMSWWCVHAYTGATTYTPPCVCHTHRFALDLSC